MRPILPGSTILSALAVCFALLTTLPAGASGFTDTGSTSPTVIRTDTTTGASIYTVEPSGVLREFSTGRLPKALIVHADPNSSGLSAAARDSVAGNLVAAGWEVEVRSLYAEEFDPVARAYGVSFAITSTDDDPVVKEYQQLIGMADALILIYPLWWNQPPAILKGWQDRIFTHGFAYEFVDGDPDSVICLLSGKKLLIINVAASSQDLYENQGYLRYLDMADRWLYGTFGMSLTRRHIIYSSTNLDLEEKVRRIEELSSLISLIRPGY